MLAQMLDEAPEGGGLELGAGALVQIGDVGHDVCLSLRLC